MSCVLRVTGPRASLGEALSGTPFDFRIAGLCRRAVERGECGDRDPATCNLTVSEAEEIWEQIDGVVAFTTKNRRALASLMAGPEVDHAYFDFA